MDWNYETDWDINPITKKITTIYRKYILSPTGGQHEVIIYDSEGQAVEQDFVDTHERTYSKRISKEEYENRGDNE